VIRCLDKLATEGWSFGFVLAMSGSDDDLNDHFETIDRYPSVSDRCIGFPAVAHTLIPDLIGIADIGLCLEQGFGIEVHTSNVPREMLAGELALIVSTELSARPFYRWVLHDKLNCKLTSNVDRELEYTMRDLASDPAERFRLSSAARTTSLILEEELSRENPFIPILQKILG
jgi:hypothetical protein